MGNKCWLVWAQCVAKHLHSTHTSVHLTRLHVAEYLPSHPHPPPPSTSPFSCLSFPFISLYRRSSAFVMRDRKGRSGLHLSFASCYHFSHLCPLGIPLPPTLLAFDIVQLVWSRVSEWGRSDGGTHARRWTSDPSTPWTLYFRPAGTSSQAVLLIITLNSFWSSASPRAGRQGGLRDKQWQ